ncbi:hypothetical protein [Corynebacterium cystitidis]|uniref:Uncharacterized protein n=1 Tax=Corynebacterium cystitidis DSM 20524 TaxID=1121357 RepID=A0A1H9U3N9_9CORY|nr:hypothetical protein [Corynebacterium cystitidis]WJY81146.1 hypothetical protein CCYS_00810 [Corynebacterium cystitidis DSM 20524]SES03848.1 hypothetical protein SAMN05661109_01632 [Corynebacterium cystitidis DSM 20524]SNV89777.1 Uncharacterised protein [Corynebacterium cystitidis]
MSEFVNPYATIPEVNEFIDGIIYRTVPDFDMDQVLWDRELRKATTREQRKEIIENLRPYAERSFDDPATRKFFSVAIMVGAKDLDITYIVDEMEKYQYAEGREADMMLSSDWSMIDEVPHKRNFDQMNRFLRLDGEILHEGQVLIVRGISRRKQSRLDERFQWLKQSRFATDPWTDVAVANIGVEHPAT